jgi:hypothetical protein
MSSEMRENGSPNNKQVNFLSATELTTITELQHSRDWAPPANICSGGDGHSSCLTEPAVFWITPTNRHPISGPHIIYNLSWREYRTSFEPRNEEWWFLFQNWK